MQTTSCTVVCIEARVTPMHTPTSYSRVVVAPLEYQFSDDSLLGVILFFESRSRASSAVDL